jgi:lipoyl(octanoyl) transferase
LLYAKNRVCQVYHLGIVPYAEAWFLQQQLVQQRRVAPDLPDLLLLLEHPPIYTLGQGASIDFVKFMPNAAQPELLRVERGGEVTYHCPGQLVAYPILNLQRHQPDLHWYLRQLEEVVLEVVGQLSLSGERLPGMTGVWIAGRKVAAIGIKVSRWITMHGFALNVCPDLNGFKQIVPCGISDRPVGSLAEFLPDITVAGVQPLVEEAFAKVFECQLCVQSPGQTVQLVAANAVLDTQSGP